MNESLLDRLYILFRQDAPKVIEEDRPSLIFKLKEIDGKNYFVKYEMVVTFTELDDCDDRVEFYFTPQITVANKETNEELVEKIFDEVLPTKISIEDDEVIKSIFNNMRYRTLRRITGFLIDNCIILKQTWGEYDFDFHIALQGRISHRKDLDNILLVVDFHATENPEEFDVEFEWLFGGEHVRLPAKVTEYNYHEFDLFQLTSNDPLVQPNHVVVGPLSRVLTRHVNLMSFSIDDSFEVVNITQDEEGTLINIRHNISSDTDHLDTKYMRGLKETDERYYDKLYFTLLGYKSALTTIQHEDKVDRFANQLSKLMRLHGLFQSDCRERLLSGRTIRYSGNHNRLINNLTHLLSQYRSNSEPLTVNFDLINIDEVLRVYVDDGVERVEYLVSDFSDEAIRLQCLKIIDDLYYSHSRQIYFNENDNVPRTLKTESIKGFIHHDVMVTACTNPKGSEYKLSVHVRDRVTNLAQEVSTFIPKEMTATTFINEDFASLVEKLKSVPDAELSSVLSNIDDFMYAEQLTTEVKVASDREELVEKIKPSVEKLAKVISTREKESVISVIGQRVPTGDLHYIIFTSLGSTDTPPGQLYTIEFMLTSETVDQVNAKLTEFIEGQSEINDYNSKPII